MKKIGLFLGIIIFVVMLLTGTAYGLPVPAWRVLAIAALMLIWWITEAVPIPVTALLPMVLLPALQIYGMEKAAAPYASPIVFLFMGGFMLALAMEKWQLHRRIALNIVRITGTNANGIILGFMLATGFLSMWISNTATTVMMLPIGVSVIDLLRDGRENDLASSTGNRAFAVSLMIGIAYAANIGGTATIVGTPPNVVFAGFIERTYNIQISFATWLAFAFPFALVLLLITYGLLTRFIFRNGLGSFAGAQQLIRTQLKELGVITLPEKRTLIVFIFTALAWIFRSQINLLFGLNGDGLLELTDPMIAIFATVALFLFPVDWKKEQFLLDWSDTQRLPWGILLLFGGGLSLADGLKAVGLIDLIGAQFTDANITGFWIILGLTAVSLFLTEIMSNVALVTVFLPVVGAVALGMDLSPLLLCIPVTLAASCAFMLPMSTPPNAIVFASGHLRIADMVKAGLWLNLIAIALITALSQWILPWFFAGG